MRKVWRFVIALAGIGIGCGIVALILYNIRFPGYEYVMRYTTRPDVLIGLYAAAGISSGLIFYFISPRIMDSVITRFARIEDRLTETPAADILFGVIGLMIGLLLALLLTPVVRVISVPILPNVINVGLFLLCGYYGCKIGVTRRAELVGGLHADVAAMGAARPKVLDTSVLIDGRIFDVCKTGFVEGTLVIPSFVLKELRHIADSADQMKRGRGRRGLDVIQSMQQELSQSVEIVERDYDDIDEVDLKLLRLALDTGGVLVTNDYNLNKVASVQNASVLNINDLANALRAVLLPGETLSLPIVKEGKEAGQGVGYLPDGTMVIVEGGRKRIGETADLVVTSSLQTSAGRMIFAKLN